MLEPSFDDLDCTENILDKAKILNKSTNTQSILEKIFVKEEKQVFVIVKFGDKDLDSAYEGVIKEVFKEFGIRVIRVDEIQDSGKISEQILEEIAKSKFIFSELTGERPNCYFETGFAYALGKELILSIKKSDKIHFDLADNRFIQWDTENDLRHQLRKRLNSILKDF